MFTSYGGAAVIALVFPIQTRDENKIPVIPSVYDQEENLFSKF